MNNWEFITFAYVHFWTLMGFIAMAILFYAIIYRKLFVSLFDPFVISALLSASGAGVVVFMYYTQIIEPRYFISYITTQGALIAGILLFNKIGIRKLRSNFQIKNQTTFLSLTFITLVVFTVFFQLYIYSAVGIPIFMESRLEAQSGGTGVGIFFRFISVWGSLALLLTFYYITQRKKHLFIGYFYILFYMITSILSGSKSAFFGIFSMFFLYAVLFGKEKYLPMLMKREPLLLGLGLASAIIVVLISHGGSVLISLMSVGERFIYAGDVYWQSYPNETIENIKNYTPFKTIFSDLLGFYRIVPWDELPQPMGAEIYKLHIDTDLMQGPNPRHNVMGYVLFGMWAPIFSFVVGAIIGTVRSLFFNAQNLNILPKLMIALIYSSVWGLEADVNYILGNYNSIFSMIVVLLCILSICYLGAAIINKHKNGCINYNS